MLVPVTKSEVFFTCFTATIGVESPVKADPSIAGKAPESLDEVRDAIRASATVPVKLPAGMLVRDAPEPLKVPAVHVPEIAKELNVPTEVRLEAVTPLASVLPVKLAAPTVGAPKVSVPDPFVIIACPLVPSDGGKVSARLLEIELAALNSI